MKRILALLLALAALFVLAACGKSPAREEEETSVEAATTETLAQEETPGFVFSIPALPGVTQTAAGTADITMPVIASQAPAQATAATRTAAAPTFPAAAGSTTTTKPITTAAATTATTIATTTAAPTTTTTPTNPTTKAPRTWTISRSSIEALGLAEVTKTVSTLNSFGTIKSYEVKGPTLKAVLEKLGADMSAISSNSVLLVKCTDPSDPAEAKYGYTLINSGDSILALTVNGSAEDTPRLFAAVESGNTYSDSAKAIKMVDTLTLSYN